MKINNSRALVDFMYKSYNVVLNRAGTVITSLRKGGKFKKVEDPLKKVEASYADCKTKYELSKSGTSSDKDAAFAAKLTLEGDLRELAAAVNLEANGSRELLNTSGFNLSKDTRSKKVLQPIANLCADAASNAGDIIASFDAQEAIKANAFAYTEGDGVTNANWKFQFTSQSSCIIRGLTPGRTITLIVTAIGPHDQVVTSQPVTVAVGYGKTGTARRRKAA